MFSIILACSSGVSGMSSNKTLTFRLCQTVWVCVVAPAGGDPVFDLTKLYEST
jgi:hypothetical protein